MKPLGNTVNHFWKMNRMARVTGVDPAEAYEKGDLSTAEWADMVTRCRGCDWVDGCGRFLDMHVEGDAAVPEACANYDVFKRLQP